MKGHIKLAKKKEQRIDYVKMFKEEWFDKYNEEKLKGIDREQLPKLLEQFEDGLAEARKKQEEYETIGTNCTKLAENVLIEFEFPNEERIEKAILEQKRKLGFLLDEEERDMREKMTSFQLQTLTETREKIKNGVEYHCTYRKEGGTTSAIGTPNLKLLAEFIYNSSQKNGLSSLRSETQVGLFFDSWKRN